MMNTPRLPAPFFVVTEMMLVPLPSILCSESPTFKLFPFPASEALMVRVPDGLETVNVAVPVVFETSLWLNERLLGLIVVEHCGVGGSPPGSPGVGVGVGVAVGVGVGVGLPLPPPLPLPGSRSIRSGVGVGVALGSFGSTGPSGVGVAVGVAVAVGDGSGSTSSGT